VRTTVTLDPDTDAIVRRLMRERRLTFKQAVNEAIRRGDTARLTTYETPTFDMGAPLVSLDKSLQLAADLEDEEIIRKLASGR